MTSTNNIYVSPYPYELHGRDTTQSALKELKTIFKTQTLPEEVAAIVIEPVLGEGGYVPAPPEFMRGLREICDEHGILFIMDEVQTGFGRTGKLFASNHHPECPPDILVMAKGLASGFPLSAVASRSELTNTQAPGTMGGTYAGNAISCAAAVATQHVIHEENMLENAKKQGKRLTEGLQQISESYGIIRDIRGLGLMIGIEFQEELAGIDKEISLTCLQNGMLMLSCSIYPTLRVIPPLNVSDEEVDMGLDIFERSLKEVMSQKVAASSGGL